VAVESSSISSKTANKSLININLPTGQVGSAAQANGHVSNGGVSYQS